MKATLFTLALALSASTPLLSQQKTEDFQITLPDKKTDSALYKTIRFIDSRRDTSNMGIVQLGAFNRKAQVKPKTGIDVQLNKVMGALTDANSGNGEIVFQLRQLLFAEITGSFSERGYFYLRAVSYAKSGDRYLPLRSIDTVAVIKAMDVTKAMFRSGSQTITNFLAQSLVTQPTVQNSYTWTEVVNLDSVEKSKTALYTATKYKDGIYNTYTSFLNQTPDKEITATVKNGEITVKAADSTGKLKKVKSKEVYAVVHEGQPYIATDYGYYILTKDKDDFYFYGKAKVTPNTGDMIAAGMMFGLLGNLLAADATSTFEMMLDHINGGFIHLREIPTAANTY